MIKDGYLIKEGGNVKSWKKRWFVLGQNTLSYYASPKSLKKVLGVINLTDVSEVSTTYAKKKDFCLQIVTKRRVYYMVAESKPSLEEWKTAIEKTIVKGKIETLEKDKKEEVKVGLTDFEFLTVIGQGSFGKVVQARYKATGDIYAMKVLEKKNIVERGEVEHTRTEKSILMKVDHPFLLRLHFSFQTADKLYLVMDFINGGELFYHIQNDHRFSNERACFYTAEICLAMSYLHTLGIVYRDLKPENILLDMKGHVKICDFGLSKEGLVTNERTKTFCGTPEYLAPEVLEGKYYNKSVDWWSVGTLIFEMLTGLPPFYSEDVQKMYNMKMTAELAFPDYIEDDAKDLIQKFLDRNPEKRLQDIEEIKKHPWFSEINWEQLYHKELTPPFVPDVTKESTELIDESFTGMDIRETIGESAAPQVKPDQFEGFTYVPKT
eukprot:TRINITY_DN27703_c0_g1_i1.p1 TRINITY_DN27703_c0_g1~~TRINITY_DN27703_c0_g1_i1.p1  ORF type:complete len:436 (-),score=138.44 TRINITY_DN27703_c0_g1_i1:181-1488(-)